MPLGDKQVSGLVEIGPLGEIINRRRVTPGDKINENQKIIAVIVAQPDRAIEPVAVIISGPLENYSKDPTVWEKASLTTRDSVELAAQRAVLAALKQAKK